MTERLFKLLSQNLLGNNYHKFCIHDLVYYMKSKHKTPSFEKKT